jgi:hypothetical protein
MGPFASPFGESCGRHSAKGAFLPSAWWMGSLQSRLQCAPLPVPLLGAFGGTRQRELLSRVLGP